MSSYIKNKNYDVVNKAKITTLKQARQTLQEKADIKETVFYRSNRYYNNGEITDYALHLNNGEVIHRKYNKINFYEHLCELADCELWDIKKEGKHVGFIVNPVSLKNKLNKIWD